MKKLSTVTTSKGGVIGVLFKKGENFYMETISGETLITPGTAGLEFDMRKLSFCEDQQEAEDMSADIVTIAKLFRDSNEPELLSVLAEYEDFIFAETGERIRKIEHRI